MSTPDGRKAGPYQNEDGDEVYLPVSDWTYREALSGAAEFAREIMDRWGRSKYDGKRDIPLHDHDDWEGCEDCPAIPCWCFELYEGPYR
jgi:hypothetical protein